MPTLPRQTFTTLPPHIRPQTTASVHNHNPLQPTLHHPLQSSATLHNRLQPSTTVHNRPQHSTGPPTGKNTYSTEPSATHHRFRTLHANPQQPSATLQNPPTRHQKGPGILHGLKITEDAADLVLEPRMMRLLRLGWSGGGDARLGQTRAENDGDLEYNFGRSGQTWAYPSIPTCPRACKANAPWRCPRAV